MAVISLTIPDNQIQRIMTAVCGNNGYSATLPNGDPNPQTQAQFTKATTAEWLKAQVRTWEERHINVDDLAIT